MSEPSRPVLARPENQRKIMTESGLQCVALQIALGKPFFDLRSVKMVPEGSTERLEELPGALPGGLGALLGRSRSALGVF